MKEQADKLCFIKSENCPSKDRPRWTRAAGVLPAGSAPASRAGERKGPQRVTPGSGKEDTQCWCQSHDGL